MSQTSSPAQSGPLPVTVVISRHPEPGREAELIDWAHGITEVASGYPGHLGAQIFPPSAPEREDLVMVFSFDTAEHLSAWEGSADRAEWLKRSEPLAQSTRTHSLTGFEDLFAPSVHATTSPPPKWKTGVVIALALFPMSLLLNWLVMPHLTSWHVVLRVLVSVVIIVPWMIYLGVPYLTKWLKPWLTRSRP